VKSVCGSKWLATRTFEHFVEELLLDLPEEEKMAKIMKTYRSLAPSPDEASETVGKHFDDN